MSVVASDIGFYQSSGGAITVTAITDATLNNLFSDVSSAEALTGLTTYKKLFVKNSNGSDNLTAAVLWRTVATLSADDEISLGLGTSTDQDGDNELTPLSSNSVLAFVSSSPDVRIVTAIGEDASGNRISKNVTLNGTTEAVGVDTFSKVYLVAVNVAHASNTITIKKGSGGATLGTIGPTRTAAICYLEPTTKADGFELGTIAAGGSQGIWLKRVVTAEADAYTLNQGTIKVEGETT